LRHSGVTTSELFRCSRDELKTVRGLPLFTPLQTRATTRKRP
jgi:hypothetical protein